MKPARLRQVPGRPDGPRSRNRPVLARRTRDSSHARDWPGGAAVHRLVRPRAVCQGPNPREPWSPGALEHTMRKLTLDVDALMVDSFEVVERDPERGTVEPSGLGART